VALGFSRLQAEQAVSSVNAYDSDPAELIRRALAWLARPR
jgi:Holliday junction resolvasome RuvABC DNA-binding subunit